jgi:hypothetical protein
MRNSPLLDSGSVRKFLWQRIDALTDVLFEMMIYILFASKLQKFQLTAETVQLQLRGAEKLQFRRGSRTDSSEFTARATDEMFMCYRLVK